MANEFVARRGIISLGGITFPQVTINGAYTATTDDYMIDITGGTFNVSLPTAVGISGKIYQIKNSETKMELNKGQVVLLCGLYVGNECQV